MTPSDLLDETRLLFHALKQWSETLLAESRLTAAMRGVLELILLGGPSTVPGMARARGMSRQHVQQQVDALLERGFLERQANPAHRRQAILADRADRQRPCADSEHARRRAQRPVTHASGRLRQRDAGRGPGALGMARGASARHGHSLVGSGG
ncbi:MAG: MarR family transcriptional regulator [Deltaproteobacteria bacterium]|nr:MarR family transcriptional regulator [Deltaproteobacteria bacterium]